MAETTFEIRYDGDRVRDGRMAVSDLAPSLLSLSRLFTDAGRILYPQNDAVSLEIESTREGSFEVELVLRGAGMAWDQVSTHPFESAAALLVLKELVIGGRAEISLFGLITLLRTRRVTAEADGPEPGTKELTADDLRLVVREEVARLYNNPPVRRELREVVEPLRSRGIDTLEILSGEQSAIKLTPEVAPAFELPELPQDEIISSQDIEVYLDVLTPDLEVGGTRQWRFGGLGETFRATIEDPAFLEKVARREEVFGAGDQLRSVVQIVQRREAGSGRIRATRRVVKVIETIRAPEQLSIDGGAQPPDPGEDEAPPALPPAAA
jgi:hypothetical protein